MYVGCAWGFCEFNGVLALVAAESVFDQGDPGDGCGVYETEFVVGLWADFALG